MRTYGQRTEGSNFSPGEIIEVWEQCERLPEYPNGLRKLDKYGLLMDFNEYGNVDSKYGWEVDHIQPVSKGGTNDLSNLQPLNWQNNRRKGDNYPF